MNPRISVIIPVYNTKDYLKESVDSIIEQKEYVHEIILVDDGSTDGSGKLLDTLYGDVDFIKILHTKNQRQGPARNLGTKLSTGEFIYYFDSDDVVKPGLFKKFNEVFTEQNNLDIYCFSASPLIDEHYQLGHEEKNRILSTYAYSRKINVICETGEEAFNKLYPIKSFSPLPYLYIFKKSIVVENNIQYRSIRFEDEEFVFQLFLNAGKTVISDEMFVDRRIREGSTMELDRCFADIVGYFETIKTLQNLMRDHNLKNETVENLKSKINKLTKAIIIMKVRSKMVLSEEEKKIYKESMKPLLANNMELIIFNYKYPIEQKLRMWKRNILN